MIVDSHCHLGTTTKFYIPDSSPERLLREMDSLNIDISIQSHTAAIADNLFEFAFQKSTDAYHISNGRILSYVVFNPNYLKETMKFVEKSLENECFVGIKIHPSFHKTWADDEKYRVIWEWASEYKYPIMSHSWDESVTNPIQKFSFPELFKKYVSQYPDVLFILGHGGGQGKGHDAALDLAKKYSNIYLDISGDSYLCGLIERFVEEVGCKRVLFGSDLTWIDARTHMGRVLSASISLDDKVRILGGNAVELFKIAQNIAEE